MSKKKILGICLLIVIVLFSNIIVSFGNTRNNELEQRQREIAEREKQTKKELDAITSSMTETMAQITRLTTQIGDYESEIKDLDSEIRSVEQSIEDTTERLEEAERRFERQEQMFQNRVVAMYEAGETTYLDVLLSSSGIADFLSNYFLVSEIATFDTEVLEQMERNRNEIKAIKEELEIAKAQIETAKANKERTASSLRSSQLAQEKHMTELSEEEKQKRVELEQFEKDQRNIQSELAEIARKAQQSNNGGSPSGLMSTQGFIWPVGRNFRINTGYPFGAVTSSGGRHTGVDFSGSGINGTPIYAVADGIVSISRAQMSGGKYVSYGEYIVIDHGRDTNGNIIFTLYAHGIAGSRQVSAGDRVTQGQRIMSVGSTGNSTGPHLHFEVLVNGSPVNPVSYLP